MKTTAKPIAAGNVAISPLKATYDAGDIVTLTAKPTADYIFKSWSNGSTTATTTITMDVNKTIAANFKSKFPAAYVLTVMASPAQGGTITINPNKPTYTEGEIVTLNAIPEPGNELKYWSSGESTEIITFPMNGDTGVTATFGEKLTGTHTLRIEEAASGYCNYDGVIAINSSANNRKVTNITDGIGKGIKYSVKVPTAGAYSVVFRYVNRGKSSAAKLKVNETYTDLSFPITSSTTKFTTTTPTNIKLVAGINTIRLETIDALEFANIDWMEITGEAPAAESCN